jgi:hypothetical protein
VLWPVCPTRQIKVLCHWCDWLRAWCQARSLISGTATDRSLSSRPDLLPASIVSLKYGSLVFGDRMDGTWCCYVCLVTMFRSHRALVPMLKACCFVASRPTLHSRRQHFPLCTEKVARISNFDSFVIWIVQGVRGCGWGEQNGTSLKDYLSIWFIASQSLWFCPMHEVYCDTRPSGREVSGLHFHTTGNFFLNLFFTSQFNFSFRDGLTYRPAVTGLSRSVFSVTPETSCMSNFLIYPPVINLVFRSYPKKGSRYENHVTRTYAYVWLFVRDSE